MLNDNTLNYRRQLFHMYSGQKYEKRVKEIQGRHDKRYAAG